MINEVALYRVPQTVDSEAVIGNSRFQDDVWDLAPFIPQASKAPSHKKLKFYNIHS
jgi:hypothetical protein